MKLLFYPNIGLLQRLFFFFKEKKLLEPYGFSVGLTITSIKEIISLGCFWSDLKNLFKEGY